MSRVLLWILRSVLGVGLLGALFVQTVFGVLIFQDLEGVPQRVPILVVVILGILAIEVTIVCVWRLLGLISRRAVFSRRSFRYVDTIIGAVAAAAALTFAFAALLAPMDIAPGVVLLFGGLGVLITGVALVVYVQRTLLRQAIERDRQARDLETELKGVI